MDVSVLIPTRRRPARLAACVARLAGQSLGAQRYEVVVGLDGVEPQSRAAAERAWCDAGGARGGLRVIGGPRRGYIDVRHRLIPELRGEIYLSLNDDVEPCRRLLEVHVRAHRKRPAIIVGDSRFVTWANPTLLDQLLQRTGLVFFWHAMDGRDPDCDWGFRHCFGLNFSVARRLIMEAGGVPSMPLTYGYDDLELAFRLARRFSLPVLYRPEARAPHRHRYRAMDLLGREQALGVAACRYARLHPAFAVVLFGRDILDPGEVASCRDRVERKQEAMADLKASFLGLDEVPAVDDPQEIARIYRKHLPLKRHCWRRGLLRELAHTSEVTHAAS